MTDTRLMVARVEEYEELKALNFIHRRWKMDKHNKLVPMIKEVNDYADNLENRWTHLMQEFDRFFKKEQLVPRDADFYYFIEDGSIYAAPKVQCDAHMIVRTF